jgi:hypothetical protein
MMYKIAAILVGLPNIVFGLLWLFDPMRILKLWGVDNASHQLMIERRMGILLLGMGVVLLFSRNAGPSPARSAICYGVMTSAVSLAILGAYDVGANGIVSGMWPGIGINAVTALVFAMVQWSSYRASKRTS